jgi:hypothetical protein
MTNPAAFRSIAGVLFALGLFVFGAPWSPSSAVLAQSQTLFLSLSDADGNPVTDLQPDEVTVQWDGVACETLDLEPIDWPVRVTVFIDNGEGGARSVQHMREGLKGFIAAMPDGVEVALLTLARQPRWVTRHTADKAELLEGIDLVVPDAGASARFLDALIEEAGRLDDDDERQYFPVILMLASDGPEGSSGREQRFEEMIRRLQENSATVHTYLASSGRSGSLQTQIGIDLGDMTGGQYRAIAASSAFRSLLPELGEDIARKHRLVSNQYRVTYAPPDGASEQPAVSIGLARSGLQLVATLDGNIK